MNKLPEMSIFRFVNFIEQFKFDSNLIYELLSSAIIHSHLIYTQQYKIEQKEKNILMIDGIVLEAFNEVIYNGINLKNISSHLKKYN
jgi:hypothetical protein